MILIVIWGSIIFVNGLILAPFLDITMPFDTMTAIKEANLKYLTIAFANYDSNKKCLVFGKDTIESKKAIISQFKDKGIKIGISFGGLAQNDAVEPARAIADLKTLVSCYQKVVDLFQPTFLDFDIENGESKQISDLRTKALKILKNANSDLDIHVTLAVTTSGFNQLGTTVLESAKLSDFSFKGKFDLH